MKRTAVARGLGSDLGRADGTSFALGKVAWRRCRVTLCVSIPFVHPNRHNSGFFRMLLRNPDGRKGVVRSRVRSKPLIMNPNLLKIRRLLPTCARLCALALLVAGSKSPAAIDGPPWDQLDVEEPPCEKPLTLNVGNDFFFEIANDLPGQSSYNDLVRLYQRKSWAALDERVLHFQETYPKSDLNEAVTYLIAQSLFERIDKPEATAVRRAEQATRNALLSYPQSKLAPVIYATAGAFWLKQRQYQKAISLFEGAKVSYPKSEVGCILNLGSGEGSFRLGSYSEALQKLELVVSRCHNFRLLTAANLRLIDTKAALGSGDVETEYEKVFERDASYVDRFYQSALFNVGELKYRRGLYNEARFYFDRFIKREKRGASCTPNAMKRLADISFVTGAPLEATAGLYLAVKDMAPASDVGRFCQLHALLLTLHLNKKAEHDRRIRLVDEEGNRIVDDSLRKRIFLEKGLALLNIGDFGALPYLAKMKKLPGMPLTVGPLADFVRSKMSRHLESSLGGPPNKSIAFIEQNWGTWFKYTLYESLIKGFYEIAATRQFAEQMDNGKVDEAFTTLKRWRDSDFWSAAGPSIEARDVVASNLLKGLFTETDAESKLSLALIQHPDVTHPFLSKEFQIVEVVAAAQIKNDERLVEYFQNANREIASVTRPVKPLTRAYLTLARVRALRELKRYDEAEAALAGTGYLAQYDSVIRERLALYEASGQIEEAYKAGRELWDKAPKSWRVDGIQKLRNLVLNGKLWQNGPEVLALARAQGLSGAEIVPFYFLAGKSQFETNKCRDAIPNLEMAIKLDPKFKERPEAQYRLGKCYLNEKKPQAARQEWDSVAKENDPFWSGLAKNELQLLDR